MCSEPLSRVRRNRWTKLFGLEARDCRRSSDLLKHEGAMTTTIAAKRCRWWRAIGYEVSMLRGLRGLRDFEVCVSTPSSKDRTAWLLRNIITEGQVLHTRILCDFCTSTNLNDIRPQDFFDNYDTDLKYDKLKELVKRLVDSF